MGFSTWNHFGGSVSAELLEEISEAMVSSGLLAAGYEYLNLDDGWAVGRDGATGEIIEDPKLFPNGLAGVIANIHARGLKFGLYTSRTSLTCLNRPGSDGYETIDAQTYANKFQIDYLKEDSCGGTSHGSIWDQYARMRDALNKTGRPIYFSICQALPFVDQHPLQHCYDVVFTVLPWVAEGLDPRTLANSYLIEYCNNYDAFGVSGGAPGGGAGAAGFLSNLDSQQYLTLDNLTGPGAFNDNDMLECCNGGQSKVEYRSQFSLWSILTSPLILGNDIRNMTQDCRDVVLNREVIAINQDDNVVRGRLVYQAYGPTEDYFEAPQSGLARMQACGSSSLQRWVMIEDNTLRLISLGQDIGCLDVFNCQTNLVDNVNVYPCHPGEAGCGSKNQEWLFAMNGSLGQLKTSLDGTCVTVGQDGLLSTTACAPGIREQLFSYNSVDETVRGANGQCLTGLANWTGNNITLQLFVKELADGGRAVAVFNRAKTAFLSMTVTWKMLNLPVGKQMRVRDLWQHQDLGTQSSFFDVRVPSHDTVMLRLTPV